MTAEVPDLWTLYDPEDLRLRPPSWKPRTLLALLDSPSTEGLTVTAVGPGSVEISVEGLCEGEIVALAFGLSAADWSPEEKRELLEVVRLAYPWPIRDPMRMILGSVAQAMGVPIVA
ncbi:hypothetical protein GBA65_14830 [Rubrobacter marinus]|uniref:Uncharacterized protein n=1 Tax=Rubrobacter marinus TaxID=2653852 RepID=A0A6G8PZD6_9ACTN|nr:hypothetical protein [Rubrobacter marinus]QIN79581.1 hypothetical protein GBA65_14830 [Rubrobacter marinus]